MPLMLDVSDEVRAEIGDAEADRLIAGENAPSTYDCTSCRNPGDTAHERTSTVLFIGEETAVLAFAHADCIPSQVVTVSEEQLASAVRNLSAVPSVPMTSAASAVRTTLAPVAVDTTPPAPGVNPSLVDTAALAPVVLPAEGTASVAPAGQHRAPSAPPADPGETQPAPRQPAEPGSAVLGITCGLVLCRNIGHPALVVEPTGPIARPGGPEDSDEFLPLLMDHGFSPVSDVEQSPAELPDWSVLVTDGNLHAVLQPGNDGEPSSWWEAHRPLPVTEAWRNAANRHGRVLVLAAPAGVIGRQPREDMLREALDKAAAQGMLLGATLQLADA